jgi:hypothetical protein
MEGFPWRQTGAQLMGREEAAGEISGYRNASNAY